MSQLLLTLAPHGASAWSRVREQLRVVLFLLLDARTVLHGLLVLHLGWEVAKMLAHGDMFAVDPRQYRGLIETGGEHFWAPFLGGGALVGSLALITHDRVFRVASALCIAVVELTFKHYLALSGAAPTAGPTYNVLMLAALWLAFAHWFPERGRLERRG